MKASCWYSFDRLYGSIAATVGLSVLMLVFSACTTNGDATKFPAGTFVSADGGVAVEFHNDGTCRWYSDVGAWEVPCKYAVNGDLYTEMTFDWPDGPKVPATYYWTYDGENLSFKLWGEDLRPHRKAVYDGQTYKKTQ